MGGCESDGPSGQAGGMAVWGVRHKVVRMPRRKLNTISPGFRSIEVVLLKEIGPKSETGIQYI